METFNEFDQSGTAPQKNFSEIINHAFTNYFKVVGWCILLFVIVLVLSIILSSIAGPITGYDPMAAQDEMQEIANDGRFMEAYQHMLGVPGYKENILLSSLLSLLVYPLYAGFLMILHRGNVSESVSFSDLFVGIRKNALQYIIYAIISTIATAIGLMLCVLPVFLVIPFFFLGVPFILFQNASAMEAISKSFNIAKNNYGTFLGVTIISILIAIVGVIFCGIGILLTAPFYFAAMYSAYCAYVGIPARNIN